MYVATYETSSRIISNAFLHNVYYRLACYFSYETSMAEKQESQPRSWLCAPASTFTKSIASPVITASGF